MLTFMFRLWGAAALDTVVYEDIERDPNATPQAVVVIALASLAAGFGVNGWNAQPGSIVASTLGFGVLALIAWVSWAVIIFQIGSRLLPEADTSVDVPQLLRTVGFSATPGLLLAFGAFVAPAVVFATVACWMTATMVVAVRQALDYSTVWRALGACLLGWLLVLAFAFVLGIVLAPGLAA